MICPELVSVALRRCGFEHRRIVDRCLRCGIFDAKCAPLGETAVADEGERDPGYQMLLRQRPELLLELRERAW
jgi:hypothetical protein